MAVGAQIAVGDIAMAGRSTSSGSRAPPLAAFTEDQLAFFSALVDRVYEEPDDRPQGLSLSAKVVRAHPTFHRWLPPAAPRLLDLDEALLSHILLEVVHGPAAPVMAIARTFSASAAVTRRAHAQTKPVARTASLPVAPPRQRSLQNNSWAPQQPLAAEDPLLEGLKSAARLASTCRVFRHLYKDMLQRSPELARQAGQRTRELVEKRRLVRRLTLNHHHEYLKREVAVEVGCGSLLVAALSVGCILFPELCGYIKRPLNFAVFTITHVLMHTLLLGAAYRTAAWLGVQRALYLGLIATVAYYCGVVTLLQAVTGITQVPSYLNLEPWGREYGNEGISAHLVTADSATVGPDMLLRHKAAKHDMPFYPLAVLLWPIFGTTHHWRLLHITSNSFAWAYGVWEFRTSYTYTKTRNGLK